MCRVVSTWLTRVNTHQMNFIKIAAAFLHCFPHLAWAHAENCLNFEHFGLSSQKMATYISATELDLKHGCGTLFLFFFKKSLLVHYWREKRSKRGIRTWEFNTAFGFPLGGLGWRENDKFYCPFLWHFEKFCRNFKWHLKNLNKTIWRIFYSFFRHL